MLGDERSADDRANGDPSDDPERSLQEIEERVRKVRHLEAFDYSERDDGRFQLELKHPPEELTGKERETIARLLAKLAERLRNC